MAVCQIFVKTLFVSLTVFLLSFTALSAQLESKNVQKMTVAQLKSHLDDTDFTIIDVRSTADWQDSTMKIKGAIREEPQQVSSWIGKYSRDKIIVLY